MTEFYRNRKTAYLALMLALGVSACGGEDRAEQTPTPRDSNESTNGKPSPAGKILELTFDDLGGGSSIIRVYPGVTSATADKKANGTYNTGDTVEVVCKTEGRTIHSDPSAGEERVSSNVWIQIEGTPDETQYASTVYTTNPEQLITDSKLCP